MKFTNLTEAEHRERAQNWREVALGCFVIAIFVGVTAGLPLLNPKKDAPITYLFMVLGVMTLIMGPPWIPIYWHERHLPHEDKGVM